MTVAAGSCGEAARAPEGEVIECAIGAGVKFAPVCIAEWGPGFVGDAHGVVIWHPDGSFRRLTYFMDEPGFEASDGADLAVVSVRGDQTEITVGQDRYRFAGQLVADAGD
jgi:hypothetical protein